MNGAIYIQQVLNNENFKCMAVGGFVRDYLLQRSWQDIDLATDAHPEQMIAIFKKNKISYIDHAKQYGSITALYKKRSYQITTLRRDIECTGRSTQVLFTSSFQKDAERRDFTINALYMNLVTKEIFDFVQGTDDLKKKRLVFIGEPSTRIAEDYLRILRLFRFYAQLHFKIERESKRSALKYLPLINFLSKERVREELFKMIDAPYFAHLWTKYAAVLVEMIPQIRPLFFLAREQFNKVKWGPGDPLKKMAHLLREGAAPFKIDQDKLIKDFGYIFKLSNNDRRHLLD